MFFKDHRDCDIDFVDSRGLSCWDYARMELCTPEGGYGVGWAAQGGGSYSDYKIMIDDFYYKTAERCPQCGCGGKIRL